MWMMGIANSYTMEASFGGSLLGTRSESHFSTQDYEQTGKAFCQTLLDFYDDGPFKERLRMKILTRLLREGSRADEPTNIKLSDYSRFNFEYFNFKYLSTYIFIVMKAILAAVVPMKLREVVKCF